MSVIISSSTSALQNIGTVSTDTFSSILPYIYLIAGIVLAFYLIETIKFWMSDSPERYTRLVEESRKENRDVIE